MKAYYRGLTNFYPICCTSAYCGKGICPPDCKNFETLCAFRAWQAAVKANCPDPVWSPSYYVATQADTRKEKNEKL